MAYVKLNKASGDFDILSSDNVAMVKLVDGSGDAKLGKLEVTYVGDVANEVTIIPNGWVVGTVATHFVQADVTALNKAISLSQTQLEMIDADLTKTVGEVSYAVK